MKEYTIYLHKNKINGKMYVGQTCQKRLNDRWHHGRRYENNNHFNCSIKKYGWDNFEHIVLMSGLSLWQSNFYEEWFIRVLDTTNEKKGYNKKKGGDNHHYEVTKQMIYKRKKGLSNMPKWKKQLRTEHQKETIKNRSKEETKDIYDRQTETKKTHTIIKIRNKNNGDIIEFNLQRDFANFMRVSRIQAYYYGIGKFSMNNIKDGLYEIVCYQTAKGRLL